MDVQPGKYASPGVEAGAFELCYYDQTDGTSGKIVDQGTATSGQSVVTLKAGRNFKSSGCLPWVKR